MFDEINVLAEMRPNWDNYEEHVPRGKRGKGKKKMCYPFCEVTCKQNTGSPKGKKKGRGTRGYRKEMIGSLAKTIMDVRHMPILDNSSLIVKIFTNLTQTHLVSQTGSYSRSKRSSIALCW